MILNSENLFLSRAKFVMKLLGVWVPQENEIRIQKLYRRFMLGLQYMFLSFQFVYIIQVWGDLDAVSQALYVIFTQACLCFKIALFLGNKNIQKELLRQIESEVFKPQTTTQEKILKDQATRIKRLLLAFIINAQVTCGVLVLTPLFDDTGSRKFPFDMWMPVKPDHSPQYQIGYAFQVITICMSAYMYFGVDSVVLSSVIFTCAQMKIIEEKILSVEPTWNLRGSEKLATQSKNYEKLVDSIKHHQAVVPFITLVENANHKYLLFQVTGSVGLIVMSALRMTVVEWKCVQFFSIVIYVVVMTCQVFLCCWCGHELTTTSENLHYVLYECIWYEQSLQFQRDLTFVMMRMHRPLILKLGHYVPLLRQTFVSILRMSYSYFAVLNQANQ